MRHDPKNWTETAIFAILIDSVHTNTPMKKIHSLLVTAYLLGGLTLMATTPFADLRAQLLNSGGSTLLTLAHDRQETLRGAADETMDLSDEAIAAAKSATAARQLMLGILLFTLGGFVHAYERLRSERPVRVTVKKRKPVTLFWLQMKF